MREEKNGGDQEGNKDAGKEGSKERLEKDLLLLWCVNLLLLWCVNLLSVPQSLNNASLCRIPPTINTWTIHGLW